MKTPRLSKVSISSLMEILKALYEEGADYIDIEGDYCYKKKNDVIKITVKPEYYIDEEEEEEEEFDEYLITEEDFQTSNKETNKLLSDEDINDLI